MFDDSYSEATAEELAHGKNKARQNRNMRLNRDRRKTENQGWEVKISRPIRQLYSGDNSEIAGIDLKRVTRLSDLTTEGE